MMSEGKATTGHLAYYLEKGISPVRYDQHDTTTHLRARDSLYRSLGLPPIAFKGKHVLEVAPGSGQNSLYVASRHPARYDLVEPNPVGVSDIRALYAATELPHTPPTLHEVRFEDFVPEDKYDIVICENWLGGLPNERALIRKLAGLVVPGGVLVITMVPPVSLVPNILRRLLTLRIVDADAPFADQVQALVDVFGPHLATIVGMGRSYEDWVQDNLLNPHFVWITMTPESLIEDLGGKLEFMASTPSFRIDWRWFKRLTDQERGYNASFVAAFDANQHNFMDHRHLSAARDPEQNQQIKRLSERLVDIARACEASWNESAVFTAGERAEVGRIVDGLADEFATIDEATEAAFREVGELWSPSEIDGADVRAADRFGRLFARETVFMSYTGR